MKGKQNKVDASKAEISDNKIDVSANKKLKTDNKKQEKEKHTKPSKNKKIYFSYGFRIVAFLLLFAVFLRLSVFFLMSSLTHESRQIINYKERSNLDYSVNLKPNDYYDTSVLGKDMLYVASLIDSIDTSFNYNFEVDNNIDMKFTYNIVAKLVIANENGNNRYLEKEYVLVSDKTLDINDDNKVSINENLNIDYNYYNSIASGFKSTYGVNSKSNLVITMKIKTARNITLLKFKLRVLNLAVAVSGMEQLNPSRNRPKVSRRKMTTSHSN